jgi:hypothetical protein
MILLRGGGSLHFGGGVNWPWMIGIFIVLSIAMVFAIRGRDPK